MDTACFVTRTPRFALKHSHPLLSAEVLVVIYCHACYFMQSATGRAGKIQVHYITIEVSSLFICLRTIVKFSELLRVRQGASCPAY